VRRVRSAELHALHFHNGRSERCIWAFDLLNLDGDDLREHSLSYRKRQLQKLVMKVRDGWLRYSESFSDDVEHLAGGRLVFERFSQLALTSLLSFKQPRVLDGDHGLVGEGGDKLNLIVGEWLGQ